jgi:hypothetical protein
MIVANSEIDRSERRARARTLRSNRAASPKQLMRQWHPDLFPDSSIIEVESLPKGFLEYHLETLTNRKQEQQFEDFCRRLAEAEICPNIKPQTGPTGGGDSKLDAATYPMAPVLAERYYWGNPTPPTDENWGFAFSCKKTWKQKIKEDAAKIAGLDRKFTNVYFITSQFSRDKARSELETELTKRYGFEAHILDRTWIVERVINRNLQRVAIRTLGIEVTEEREARLGPRDTERQRELEQVLQRVHDLAAYEGNDYTLAQDYLQAAILARGLGKPRHEVDGLFQHARRFAAKTGNQSLKLRCGYNQAWSTWWWFEDLEEFSTIYGEIEGMVVGSPDVEDCESILNLWILIWSIDRRKKAGSIELKVAERGVRLAKELDRLAGDYHRLNSALQARSDRLMMKLCEEFGDERAIKEILIEMGRCLEKSVGLGTYPAFLFINKFKTFGQQFSCLPEFDSLFERMCQISRHRSGETSEGRLLYERGLHQLLNGEPKDALRYLGRARSRLYKGETLTSAARASLGCSDCYLSMKLYWAARMEALVAAHISLQKDQGEFLCPVEGFWALTKLARIDLFLGRFAAFLAWYRLASMTAAYLKASRYDIRRLVDELDSLDLTMAVRLMRLRHSEVYRISDFTGSLERLKLQISQWALMYRSGQFSQLIDEFKDSELDSPAKIDEFFQQFLQVEIEEDFREPSGLAGENLLVFGTKVLGVEYCFRVRNEFGPVVLAENLLGIIEAAFSLARWENLAFILDTFTLLIDARDDGTTPPEIHFERGVGEEGHSLIWKPNLLEWLHLGPRDEVCEYLKLFLFNLLFMTTVDPVEDLDEELEHWQREETFTRALGVSPVSIIVEDLIGKEAYDIDYWRQSSVTSTV